MTRGFTLRTISLVSLLAGLTIPAVRPLCAIDVSPGETVAIPAILPNQLPGALLASLALQSQGDSGISSAAIALQQSVYGMREHGTTFVYALTADAPANADVPGSVTIGGFAENFLLPGSPPPTETKIYATNVFTLASLSGQSLVVPLTVTRSADGATLTFNYGINTAANNGDQTLAPLVVQTDSGSYATVAYNRGEPFNLAGVYAPSTALAFNMVVGPYETGAATPLVPEPNALLLLPMALCGLALRQGFAARHGRKMRF